MKLWIDDVRPAPEGYEWCKSVNQAISRIRNGMYWHTLELIDIDHDAGDFKDDGGDYIEVLNKIEDIQWNFPALYYPVAIHIHSMNPVGVENMRRIIKRNGWKEI